MKKITCLAVSLLILSQVSLLAQSNPNVTDYTSKVPRYIFPNTLVEQEEALDNNPLLKRFNESRQKLSSDKHRPHYHYVNPEARLNDPNGLSYWKGNWHLFYQAYPPEDPRQHWGHAISKDLIHWRDLPLAIYPNPERAVFSGSALVEEDRVIAMYHGTEVGNMVAVSSDPLLLNWEKLSGQAVIPIKDESGLPLPYSVFDPSIWKENDTYYALSAGRENTGPGGRPIAVTYLFRSKDLINWQYMHPFVENDRFTLIGDDFACPYFWPIGDDKYILLFYSHMSGGQYLIGEYDTENQKFIAESNGKFNKGPSNPGGVHAPSATPDGNGNVITIFNMNPAKPTDGWNQIMTLPMKLSYKDGLLFKQPVESVESLRSNEKSESNIPLPANTEVKLTGHDGNVKEYEFEIEHNGTNLIEINVLMSSDKREYTRIELYPRRGYTPGRNYWRGPNDPVQVNYREAAVSLITSNSSIAPDVQSRAPETGTFKLADDENFRVRIFVDKSVVEVYVNEVEYVAARVYPELEQSTSVSIKSIGKDANLTQMKSWSMQNIWSLNKDEWSKVKVWR